MVDVMIDLETWGVRMGSAMRSVGAVAFDPLGQGLGRELYVNVDDASCKDIGLTHDESTEKWWSEQSAEAQAALLVEPIEPVQLAMVRLNNFIRVEGGCVWSHGATFDIPLVACAMEKLGLRQSWEFWDARDTRTLFDLAKAPRGLVDGLRKPGSAHNALEDAKAQALAVQHCMRLVMSWRTAKADQDCAARAKVSVSAADRLAPGGA